MAEFPGPEKLRVKYSQFISWESESLQDFIFGSEHQEEKKRSNQMKKDLYLAEDLGRARRIKSS